LKYYTQPNGNIIQVCSYENKVKGHEQHWHYSINYKDPVCGKCGLVVKSEKDPREIQHKIAMVKRRLSELWGTTA
jgi:hypothetical protein